MFQGNGLIPWILAGIGLVIGLIPVWISATAKPKLDSERAYLAPLEPEITKAVLNHGETVRKLRVVPKYEHFE